MSDRPCMLNPEKWRVRQYVVPVPKQAAVARPWQLQSPVPAPLATGVSVSVWGIWPPNWDIDGPPMLVFPTCAWHMAFRAAWDRAQFAAAIPPSQQVTLTSFQEEIERHPLG